MREIPMLISHASTKKAATVRRARTLPLALSDPVATHGTAATLEEAKAKFRDNWTKAKASG
jgi:hypothetical protein